MKIITKWLDGLSFVSTNDSNQSIVMDIIDGIAPTPMQLLLMGLTGCTGIDILSILKKKHLEVANFEMEIDEVEKASESPRVFTKIHIIFRFMGNDLTEKAVKDAVMLSQEKYCSVSAMLKHDAQITYTIYLNGENI